MPRSKKLVDDDEEQSPAHVCVVYDPKDGRVAHVHEFYGKGFKPDECARTALDTVKSLGHAKAASLKVLHPRELKYEPDMMLRVNPKSLEIVTAKRPVRRRPSK